MAINSRASCDRNHDTDIHRCNKGANKYAQYSHHNKQQALLMLVTLSTTLMLVIICVALHYEAMRLLRRAGSWLHRNNAWHRWHLSILVCGLLIAHVFEVLLFGWAYCGLIDGNGYGDMAGSQAADFAECTYFSFANYTSLGYGDLVPSGPLRFMAGMEALTGLVLIGWTASFMYLQMRHVWERERS